MSGIAGVCGFRRSPSLEESTLRAMLGAIRHRGPDRFGVYLDERVGLGQAHLGVPAPGGARQPVANEDRSMWIVLEGDVYNHSELRRDLVARGHRFHTASDAEVALHAYEQYGADSLLRLNGQFALAVWDARRRALFLARDRLGMRPLFYTETDDALVFGSEIKALLACPGVTGTPDAAALDQIFTFWSTLSPRTFFRGVLELPPGHFMRAQDDRIEVTRYWEPTFPEESSVPSRPTRAYAEELRDLLVDAVRIRLRANVAVGAYLSGGLDSSLLAAIACSETSGDLETFSIAFTGDDYDESVFQVKMAQALGTEHRVVRATHADIGRVFPKVVWHAETPLMRTAPAPMFLLSKLVRENRFEVVLSGEGADEMFAGYDLFREARIRRFWAEQPESTCRPALFDRIYPWKSGSSSDFLKAFFGLGLTETDARDYSHALRWRTTARAKRFFSEDVRREAAAEPGHLDPPYPEEFDRWGHLQQAQYLETTILLSQYLLSSQGDRMGMAHSVEGRFPFLDHRVVEFASGLPASLKLNGLTEKYLLKEVSREWLPPAISDRPKQPYRAPIHGAFFGAAEPEYVGEVLSASAIEEAGYFNPKAVDQLVAKLRSGRPLGETDDMALAGIISTQLLHRQFVTDPRTASPLGEGDDVKVVTGERPS